MGHNTARFRQHCLIREIARRTGLSRNTPAPPSSSCCAPSRFGRTPMGAQTQRTTGFRPSRCSSVAKASTGRPDEPAPLRRRPQRLFFKRLLLGFARRFRIARTRLLDRPSDRLQRLPPALRRDVQVLQLNPLKSRAKKMNRVESVQALSGKGEGFPAKAAALQADKPRGHVRGGERFSEIIAYA